MDNDYDSDRPRGYTHSRYTVDSDLDGYTFEFKPEPYWEKIGLGGYLAGRNWNRIGPVNYLAEIGKQLALHPDKWRQAIEKPQLLGWFVGKVMKETDGRADYETVETIFKALAKVKAW
jgi:hypothetical protein